MRHGTAMQTGVEEDYREAPVAGETERSSIDFLDMTRTLIAERRIVLTITLIVFLLATTLAFVLHPKYTSEVSFIPPTLGANNSLAAVMAGQLTTMGTGDLLGMGKSAGELYSGIIRSRSVTDSIIKRFDLIRLYRVKKQSEAEKALISSTAVTVDTKSTIVTVAVTQRDPTLAHDIAAAYMEALRGTEGRLALSQASQRRLFFEQQLEREKDALEDAEVDLKKTEERSGLIAPIGQTASEIQTIAETQAQIASRQVQLAALRQAATEENPQVIRLRSEIADLQGQLQRLENGKEKSTPVAIPTSRVPEIQLEYVRKQREVKYHETLFEALSKQYETARLEEAREAPVLQVLDSPSYPDSKSAPKRMYIMIGGLFGGFILAALWVLLKDGLFALLHSLRAA